MFYSHIDSINRKIRIGLVYQCKKDYKFGLLYGFSVGVENKLFYFEKEPELEISQNTMVSYLAYVKNEFSPKAEFVYPVFSLPFKHDSRIKYRDDDQYHDDESWRLINEGKPYIISGGSYTICYPIISDNVCNIWSGLLSGKEDRVFRMYMELIGLHYSGWPTVEVLANVISEFKEYTDSMNAYEIMEQYSVWQRGVYHSRPGKDDYYCLSQYRHLSSEDSYLLSLLPNKKELVLCEDNTYWSDKYWVGTQQLPDVANEAIAMAKSEYSKEKHVAYLINDYYTKVVEKRDRYNFLKKEIEMAFDIDKAERVASWFYGELTDIFLEKLNSYNQSGS